MTTAATAVATPTPADELPLLRLNPRYIKPSRLANYDRLIAARAERRLTFDAGPAHIRLEPHASCNLRCCWAQRNPKHPALRPRGAAEPDLARWIVDDAGEYLFQATLCHWGEPMLNRRFAEIAGIFHDADIATSVHSNMTLIDQPLAEAIVASGLDEISGSIDGVAQNSYEKYRVLGDVDRAINGLKLMVDARGRAGSTTPLIAWQFLVFDHNQDEIETARRMASDIGVDEFRCFGGSGRPWSAASGLGERIIRPRPDLLCKDPWSYLAIDWDGAVHLCCRAFKAEHVMGDIQTAGIRAAFNNERFQLARRVIRDGHIPPDDRKVSCTGCNHVTDYEPHIASLGHSTGVD